MAIRDREYNQINNKRATILKILSTSSLLTFLSWHKMRKVYW